MVTGRLRSRFRCRNGSRKGFFSDPAQLTLTGSSMLLASCAPDRSSGMPMCLMHPESPYTAIGNLLAPSRVPSRPLYRPMAAVLKSGYTYTILFSSSRYEFAQVIVVPFHDVSYDVMSCHVMSWCDVNHITSHHVMWCHDVFTITSRWPIYIANYSLLLILLYSSEWVFKLILKNRFMNCCEKLVLKNSFLII